MADADVDERDAFRDEMAQLVERHIRLYLFQCGVDHVPLRNLNLGEGWPAR